MNMKKVFTAIIILAAFTGISHADIIYTTTDGSMGAIPVNSAKDIGIPSLQYSGLGSDTLLGAYTEGTNPRIMIVNRSSNLEAPDTALIFSTSNLTAPSSRITLNGVYDTKTFASSYNGRSLFFASRGNTSIIEFDSSSPDIPINLYTYTSADSEYEPEFVDMAVNNNYIYAIFRASPDKLEMLVFDGQLKEGVKNTRRGLIRNDATGLAPLASNRFAIGAEYGLSIVTNSATLTTISSDYPVTAMCKDRGYGVYYTEQSESGDINLCHYDSDKKEVTLIDSLQSISDCQLVRDSYTNILAAMMGDSIYLYDMTENDELIVSFSASDLGGTPMNIAVSRVEYDEGKSSGSNCNVSCMGLMLAGVLGFALRRR